MNVKILILNKFEKVSTFSMFWLITSSSSQAALGGGGGDPCQLPYQCQPPWHTTVHVTANRMYIVAAIQLLTV